MKNLTNSSEFLTPPEVAALLGVRVRTLAIWRCTGRHDLPFVRVGASIRYRRDAVDAWLASRSGTSTAAVSAALA
jgi:excisionase family DNA binding protein